VSTDGGTIDGDDMVVALGAVPRPDLVPGLAEYAHDVWDERGVTGLSSALAAFEGGSVAIVLPGGPYTCPPAPFECPMLLDDHLRERGLRDRTDLTVTTPQPMLLPNAGKDGSAWLAEQLTVRGISFQVKMKVDRVESGRVVCEEGSTDADIVIGVPPHRVPSVVRESGLTGDGEWIKVDLATLETEHPNVFAIGEVTKITLANGLPLPKAGVMAELQGRRVAEAIAADVLGQPAPAPFYGQGFCFMEMGKTRAALIRGDFFAVPEPRIEIDEVSEKNAIEKHRFEAERLESWFGT
jgi:sulfide:quinone oxidoreductase